MIFRANRYPSVQTLIVLVFMICNNISAANAADFVEAYIAANGGCHTFESMIGFEHGSSDQQNPFGKAATEWTDEDISTLRSAMKRCIPNPNLFDFTQERDIIRRVQNNVEAANRRQQERAAEREQKAEREAQGEKHENEIHARRKEAEAKEDSRSGSLTCSDPEIIHGLEQIAQKTILSMKSEQEVESSVADSAEAGSHSCRATFALRSQDGKFEERMQIRYQLRGDKYFWYSSVFDIPRLFHRIDQDMRNKSRQDADARESEIVDNEIAQLSKSTPGICPDWMKRVSLMSKVDAYLRRRKALTEQKSDVAGIFEEFRQGVADAARADVMSDFSIPIGPDLVKLGENHVRVVQALSRPSLAKCFPQVEEALVHEEQSVEERNRAAEKPADSNGQDSGAITVETATVQEEGMGSYSSDGGVQTFHPHYYPVKYIILTAHTDNVRIEEISANRGNCLVVPTIRLPTNLRFGETLRARAGCDPIEIGVTTSEGKQTFNIEEK